MAIWNVSNQRDGISVKYVNSQGIVYDCDKAKIGSSLQKVLTWISSEMDLSDVATLNGQLILQRFAPRME